VGKHLAFGRLPPGLTKTNDEIEDVFKNSSVDGMRRLAPFGYERRGGTNPLDRFWI
jgi:hypothetical protein